jgi:predicted nucleic acid-binding protein
VTDYFLDASAVVKRYADEAGSAWVRQITDPQAQNTILLAEITLAEVTAALAAKQRAPKGITLEQRNRVLSRFFQDCDEHFTLVSIDRSVIDRAVDLAQRHRLRAYDAVQLATALEASAITQAQALPALTFVAADTDLLTAAAAEHLSVENPLNYTHLDS